MIQKKPTETPMMKQFFAVKAQHPEAMLLFRCGDFYETYGDDALTASKVLGIVLTKRSYAAPDAIPMAGFRTILSRPIFQGLSEQATRWLCATSWKIPSLQRR